VNPNEGLLPSPQSTAIEYTLDTPEMVTFTPYEPRLAACVEKSMLHCAFTAAFIPKPKRINNTFFMFLFLMNN
jgi:hypothetical protein